MQKYYYQTWFLVYNRQRSVSYSHVVKKIFNYILLVSFPLLLLGAAELLLRLTQIYSNQSSAFTEFPSQNQYLQLNPEYVDNYFTGFSPAVGIYPFRKAKNERTFRIVVLGGSTTAGFPYQFDRSFSSVLERNLTRENPCREVEVINLGITAFNSFAIRDLGLKVLEHNPDLAIIYGGHNEFYGAYGIAAGLNSIPFGNVRWVKNLAVSLHQSHLYLALKDLLITGSAPYEDKTLMAKALSDREVPAQSPIREKAFQHFKANITDVINAYGAQNIPVIISTVSSNLHDQPPFGDNRRANNTFKDAQKSVAINAKPPLNTFEKARDLDPIPFRAPSEINEIIHKLAEHDQVWLVNSRNKFARHYRTNLPGDELFLDHLHFNAKGHEILARAFASEVDAIFGNSLRYDSSIATPTVPLDSLQLLKAEYRIMSLKNDEPFRSFGSPAKRRHVKDSVRQIYARGSELQQQALMYNNSTIGIEDLYRNQFGKKFSMGDTLQALSNLKSLLYYRQLREERSLESVFELFYRSKKFSPYLEDIFYSVSNLHHKNYFIEAVAALYLEQRNLLKAEKLLKIAQYRNPKSPSLLYNLARLFSLKGDTTEARQYYNRYHEAKNL